MSIECKCIYTSCSCNKMPNIVDWGNNNFICYGACNAIHIFSYSENCGASFYQTILSHKKLVTSVHWLRKTENAPESELVSTSADQTAIIWKLVGSKFTHSATLVGHSNVVRNATGNFYLKNNNQYLQLATLSSDSTVKIWLRENDNDVKCIQTITLGNGFAIDAKFVFLNESDNILIMAQDDSKIHFYVQNEQSMFIPTIKLAGHEDWIQNIDVVQKSPHNYLIASGSQDSYIRIWEIMPFNETVPENSDCLKVDATTFQINSGKTYSVMLESVLSGHENWVYSVRWTQQKRESGEMYVELLSSSMDKSVVIWECESNIWLEKVRVGEVGGSSMGFLGALFSPDAKTILAHGHVGAVYIWHLNEEEDIWQPGLSFGGHHLSVQDIDWDPDGEYVLSCSLDQTSRLHAPYTTGGCQKNWFEIARPQIHGYDMISLHILNRFMYVSAGDEKVLRVFEAPRSFAESLNNLTHLNASSHIINNLVEGASVPSLGLSNKAVYEGDIKTNRESGSNINKHPKDKYPEFYYIPTLLKAPPSEDTLQQNTLWPETQKLYGHPYEIYTIAVNKARTLIASACKASKAEHAGIILWSTSTWKQVGHLIFHALTICQIEFSPDDQYLLSVSRDRMWAVYQYAPNESPPYKFLANLDKKSGVHTRIIWSCSWSFDSQYFATASRDKKVAVWGQNTDTEVPVEKFSLCCTVLDVEDSATAVSFAPKLILEKYLIAIGLENGSILLSFWCKHSGWDVLQTVQQDIAHHLNINRLKFSPSVGEAGQEVKNSNVIQLASCGSDHHVKIYNILLL